MSAPLTAADLAVGKVYRGKRRRKGWTFAGAINDDRQIIWIGIIEVQYDSDFIRDGRHYPKVSIADFLKWAGREVEEWEKP